MAVRKVERELEQMGALRDAPADEARTALRKALKDPVNLMVAKAAAIAAERQFRELTPDLVRAFDRLAADGARRDPKCWGKSAIARALAEMEHREPAVYLRGMTYIQMEAVWGGSVDTADILRGICVLGLVACTGMRREDILRALIDAAADSAGTVRAEAVRAIAQMDEPLLLRLKARLGDPAPEVMGQVFDSLLALEGEEAVKFVAGFLRSGEHREEAAMALGSSKLAGAVTVLREALGELGDVREVLLRALSLSRQEEALAVFDGGGALRTAGRRHRRGAGAGAASGFAGAGGGSRRRARRRGPRSLQASMALMEPTRLDSNAAISGSWLQNIAKLVHAFHQAVLGETVHREFHRAAGGRGERLVGQIDLHRGRGVLRDGGEQLGMDIRRHHDGQQRVLQRVLLEDVGERSADHGAETELRERPRRVLARTAAAEIVAGQQHLRALRLRAG